MALLGIDLTALPEAVRKRMGEIWSRDNEIALIQARVRQEKIAKFYHENEPRWREGFGPMVMAIDPYWRSYFAQLHQSEIWAEKDFREWLGKQEPMFRVTARAPKTCVGWEGKEKRRGEGSAGASPHRALIHHRDAEGTEKTRKFLKRY